jgi:hypothetical protein
MRVLTCLLAVLFLSALAAAQQPSPPPPPPPPQIDLPTNGPMPPAKPASATTGDVQKTVTVSADWLKRQSDDLLVVVTCYMDKTSIDNLTKMETDEQWDITKSIEVRIKILTKLAKQNTASRCQ